MRARGGQNISTAMNNQQAFQTLVLQTPRAADDGRYDSTELAFSKLSGPLFLLGSLCVLGALVLAALGFFGVVPPPAEDLGAVGPYVWAIVALLGYVVLKIVDVFLVQPGARKRTRALAKTTPMTAVGVVQSSDFYSVVVFAPNNPELAANPDALVAAANRLRSIRDGQGAGPEVAHLRARMAGSEYFGAEALSPEATGAQGVFWRVVSAPDTPSRFDERADALLAFVTQEEGETYLKFVNKKFYKQHLS